MRYRIFADRVKLIDSVRVPKADFEEELNRILYYHPSCRLWGRSLGSLRREWAAHNLAYILGIRQDQTTDCDLEYEQPWYVRLFYTIAGAIALLIVK